MKPYYDHDGVTIYHGDCREILPGLGLVGSVVTDPPYLGARGKSWEKKRVPLRVDYAPFTLRDLVWLANQCEKIVCDSWAVVFQDFPGMEKLRQAFGCSSMRLLHAPLVWCKPPGAFAPCGSANSVPKSVDYITAARSGAAVDVQRVGHYVSAPYSPRKELHRVGGKPVELMRRILADFTEPGGTVVDPFAGGGTTLLAALETGRNAVGVEISERYCEVAARRLAAWELLS